MRSGNSKVSRGGLDREAAAGGTRHRADATEFGALPAAPVRRKNRHVSKDLMTSGPSRRSIAKGAAWAVPAVSVAAAAPALAASTPDCTDPTVWQPAMTIEQGCLAAVAGVGVSAGWQICAGDDCAIPAGTVFTERVISYHDQHVTGRVGARLAVAGHVTLLTTLGLVGALFENFDREFFGSRTEMVIDGRTATVRTRTFTSQGAIQPGQCSGYGYLLTVSALDKISHEVMFEPTATRVVLDPGLLNQCN